MSATSIDTTAVTPPVPSGSGLRARLGRFRIGPLGLILPAAAVVLVGAGGPLVILVLYSVGVLGDKEPAGFGVYQEILSDGYYWDIYLKSIRMSAMVTLISLAIGIPLAFIISKSRGWTRTLLMCAIVMPLMVNIVVRNLGWVIIITDSGLLNKILAPLGLQQSMLGSITGIALVLVHVGVPFIVLPMLTSIDRLDRAEVEAARALGAHPIVAFWRITLPRVATSAVAGSTLVFIIAMGSLVTPRFLGQGKVTIVPTLIVQQTRTFRWERTAALSMLLFVIVLAYAVITQFVSGRLSHGRSERSRRRGSLVRGRPLTRVATGLNRLPAMERGQLVFRRVYMALSVLFLLFPMFVILKAGFDSSPTIQVGFDGFTFEWFGDAFSEDGFRDELLFSLKLAVVAVALSLVISMAASWAIARTRFPGRDAVISLLMSPLLIPQASLAIGFVLFFIWLGTNPSFERMLFAHLVVVIPYMCRMLVSAFESVDAQMEEAASSLGARPLTVFWRVTLPLIKPGLTSALLFGFLVSFDEAAISVLLASGDTTTFPVKLLAAMEFNPTPVGAAVSALLIIIITATLIPLERKFGIASNAGGG